MGLLIVLVLGVRADGGSALGKPPGTPSVLRDLPGLENVVPVMEGLVNGSAPEGDAGFDSLQRLGIKTIISVDGAVPDVERAKAHGMRYVHLPIRYGGIDEERGLRIIRAVRDLPGPTYIHCFHGKHRSPAVSALAAVGLGRMSNAEALAFMKAAGTSEKYAALYRAVGNASLVGDDRLDRVPEDFPACFELPGFVRKMSAVGTTWDDLDRSRRVDWQVPPDHPDLDRAALGRALARTLGDACDDESVTSREPEFQIMLKQSSDASRALAEALATDDRKLMTERFGVARETCLSCHSKYRD